MVYASGLLIAVWKYRVGGKGRWPLYQGSGLAGIFAFRDCRSLKMTIPIVVERA
jgi:hypothetical protein